MSPFDCSKLPTPAEPLAKLVVTVPPSPNAGSRVPAWACAKLTPNARPTANSPAIVWNVVFFIVFPFDFDFDFASQADDFGCLPVLITDRECIYSRPLRDKSLVVCKLSTNGLREVKAAQALGKGVTLPTTSRALATTELPPATHS